MKIRRRRGDEIVFIEQKNLLNVSSLKLNQNGGEVNLDVALDSLKTLSIHINIK